MGVLVRRIVERVALILTAVMAAAAAVWSWLRMRALGEQLSRERSARVIAEVEVAQADADAAAAQAREQAARDQSAKLAALNAEVVHVDPDDPGLAAAFDRASGRRDSER